MKTSVIMLMVCLLSACHSSRQTAAPAAREELFNRNWKLVELNGSPPDLTSKEPFLLLEKATGRITGNGGCNSFFGTFKGGENGEVSFSDIGSTKMACPGLHVETEFFRSLGQVNAYQLRSDSLFLKNGATVLARLVAAK